MSLLAIILATFVSEDLTCVTVALLIQEGKLPLWEGLLACWAGIFVGDMGLWLVGRIIGPPLLHRPFIKRYLHSERVDQLSVWLDHHGWAAILAARFMPGMRIPTYVLAGMLGKRARRFITTAAIAGALWTPLLIGIVMTVGPSIVEPLKSFLGHAWLAILAAALVLALIIRIVTMTFTEDGRARLIANVSRFWRWEFWPPYVFYLPLMPWILWLSIRYRGLTLPTATNPAIPHGGLVGESKAAILSRLPHAWIIPFALIDPGETSPRVQQLQSVLQQRGWSLPVILKPDAAQRGAGLKLLKDSAAAAEYFERHPAATLVQPYHPGPYEAGIFYCRRPGEARGWIVSITDKVFPEVMGDGSSTIEELIWRHPRLRMQARTFLKRLDDVAEDVIPAGQPFALAVSGNHCQGTMFRDGAHLITPELESRIDDIARSYEGFFFGRFDVRYSNVEEFRAGRGFAIVELNGATSESTNLYDPTWSLWRAYRQLFHQWRLAFEIGSLNRDLGHSVSTMGDVWRAIREYYGQRKLNPIAD